jgi:hypothetical protein
MVDKGRLETGHQWFTPAILVSWEAEIRRIEVLGQNRQIVPKSLISKITRTNWTGGMTQAVKDLLCNHESWT